METRLNKPRAFLSHSKADAGFIERLSADLRGCQIEPWLDTDEIRHGKPWLDAIFEEGIPTCDAVVVYFTDNSLESAMVKKEMDAAILQQLRDRRVAFLPYASSEAVRSRLRADIRALQTPLWDELNYPALLPKVVAEIWRSYLERTLALAVQDEKVRRLEAELALENLRRETSDSVFSAAEEAEFKHIWAALDVPIAIRAHEQAIGDKGKRSTVRTFEVTMRFNTLLPRLIRHGYDYSFFVPPSVLREPLIELLPMGDKTELDVQVSEMPVDEMLMYGLIERVAKPPQQSNTGLRSGLFDLRAQYQLVWSQKSQRLLYWLDYRDELPDIEFGKVVEATV